MDKQRETCAKKRKKARNLRHRDKKRETCATGTKSVKHAPHRQKVRNKCHRGKKREACAKKDKKHETKDNSFSKAGVWLQEEVEMNRFLCAFFFTSRIQNLHTCLAITQVSQDDWTRVIASKNGVRASYLISSIVLGKNCHSVYCSQRHTRLVCHIYFLKNCTVYI